MAVQGKGTPAHAGACFWLRIGPPKTNLAVWSPTATLQRCGKC